MSERAARVVVADRQEVFRAGLKSAFEAVDWLKLVGEARDVDGLNHLLRTTACEVVLADLALGDGARQSIVARVRRAVPAARVVVVAADGNSQNGLKEALTLGASGFLRRDAHIDEFVNAVEKVADGNHYIQAELLRHLLDGSGGSPQPAVAVPSPRQMSVLEGVAGGKSNRQIARELGISETTVKADLRVVFAKLRVASRAEAIAVAMRSGLID